MVSFSASLPYETSRKISEVSAAEVIKPREAAALLINMGYSHNHLDGSGDVKKNSYREKGLSVTISLSVPEPIYSLVLELVDATHFSRSAVVTRMIEAGYEAWKQEKAANGVKKNE